MGTLKYGVSHGSCWTKVLFHQALVCRKLSHFGKVVLPTCVWIALPGTPVPEGATSIGVVLKIKTRSSVVNPTSRNEEREYFGCIDCTW